MFKHREARSHTQPTPVASVTDPQPSSSERLQQSLRGLGLAEQQAALAPPPAWGEDAPRAGAEPATPAGATGTNVRRKLAVTSASMRAAGGDARGLIAGRFTTLRQVVSSYERLVARGASTRRLRRFLKSQVRSRAKAYLAKHKRKSKDDKDALQRGREACVQKLLESVDGQIVALAQGPRPEAPAAPSTKEGATPPTPAPQEEAGASAETEAAPAPTRPAPPAKTYGVTVAKGEAPLDAFNQLDALDALAKPKELDEEAIAERRLANERANKRVAKWRELRGAKLRRSELERLDPETRRAIKLGERAFEEHVDKHLRDNAISADTFFERNPIPTMPTDAKEREAYDPKPKLGAGDLVKGTSLVDINRQIGGNHDVYKGSFTGEGNEEARDGYVKYFETSKEHLAGAVHSSRMAAQLGKKDMIAENRYFEMEREKRRGGSEMRQGVVSLAAKGEPIRDACADIDFEDPEIQKQFFDLQWFDHLSGQSDRHGENLYYDKDTKKLTGIDDDRSFTSKDSTDHDGVKDGNAHITELPQVVDQEMYDTLMKLRPQDVLRAVMRRGDDPLGVKGMVGDWDPNKDFAGYQAFDDQGETQRSAHGLVVARLRRIQNHLKQLKSEGKVVKTYSKATYAQAMSQEETTDENPSYLQTFAKRKQAAQIDRARPLIDTGRCDEAIELLRVLEKTMPRSAELHRTWISALEKAGRYDAAVQRTELVRQLDSGLERYDGSTAPIRPGRRPSPRPGGWWTRGTPGPGRGAGRAR